jgi:hypothetical protein
VDYVKKRKHMLKSMKKRRERIKRHSPSLKNFKRRGENHIKKEFFIYPP